MHAILNDPCMHLNGGEKSTYKHCPMLSESPRGATSEESSWQTKFPLLTSGVKRIVDRCRNSGIRIASKWDLTPQACQKEGVTAKPIKHLGIDPNIKGNRQGHRTTLPPR